MKQSREHRANEIKPAHRIAICCSSGFVANVYILQRPTSLFAGSGTADNEHPPLDLAGSMHVTKDVSLLRMQ